MARRDKQVMLIAEKGTMGVSSSAYLVNNVSLDWEETTPAFLSSTSLRLLLAQTAFLDLPYDRRRTGGIGIDLKNWVKNSIQQEMLF